MEGGAVFIDSILIMAALEWGTSDVHQQGREDAEPGNGNVRKQNRQSLRVFE